ncbi:uncharacterized protein CIMG_10026 [Coccidioides immitis RS]|uniref:Uncharacterized protein n=7 Tax=Coccidioides TaxID=5500 RepID=J3K0N6_COCIM|nr:uncharacterized protein CIMG_10026 [Coccidioides immitis RS]XP_003072003.1 hypothetical protein CPC735_011760 [Coccidioides posadasii C735 delta SOWgp]EFW18892.1 conserved hypothetical protein [Coccidioides posadasii str. Silveira]KMM71233.1 hypothetical protein CPAG_07540 [Coccidioides posadasii RMSCC 3488]KMP09371.1 hypothetical protein CIRG_09541 [Coccidioides immitis RMSCC 2394]KMU75308.1 hypothetical protein CISG_04727 [Coccidioides immitis RMSCC 3703]KMU88463.1 hypothetical protein C|eukprot:XP_003072003.1 hypothetical protein CPC735_011760 [Coccidioides posadasii C735 delta SOWgp]
MFRFHKPLDIITLFHKPALPSSLRALALLKQASANAAETATIDQASDHSAQNKLERQRREQFDLTVTEEPPTPDQLKLIMDYMAAGAGNGGVGAGKPGDLVSGARDRLDALRRLKEDGERFVRPVVVDWNNGKAVLGTNESAILKLLQDEPPHTPDDTA